MVVATVFVTVTAALWTLMFGVMGIALIQS